MIYALFQNTALSGKRQKAKRQFVLDDSYLFLDRDPTRIDPRPDTSTHGIVTVPFYHLLLNEEVDHLPEIGFTNFTKFLIKNPADFLLAPES
jgi:hypothetical protein